MKKLFSLVVVSFLVLSVVGFVSALSVTRDLTTTGVGSSSLTSIRANSGSQSALISATFNNQASHEGRVKLTFNEELTLNELNSISWMQYVTKGYIAHVDVALDFDNDGVVDNTLVFEYDKVDSPSDQLVENMNYARNSWVNTFDDKGMVDLDAIAWLNSGAPGPVGGQNYIAGTLAGWKAGTVDGSVNGSAVIPYIEIEVDGWVVESEAFVDDVMVNGELVKGFEGNSQGVEATVGDNVVVDVSPKTLSFGNIPFSNSVTVSGSDVVVDVSQSDTVSGNVYVDVELTQDTNGFFADLLEFDAGDGFVNLVNLPTLIIGEDASAILNTRLDGNTAQYGAGQKSATLTYTVAGEPPN